MRSGLHSLYFCRDGGRLERTKVRSSPSVSSMWWSKSRAHCPVPHASWRVRCHTLAPADKEQCFAGRVPVECTDRPMLRLRAPARVTSCTHSVHRDGPPSETARVREVPRRAAAWLTLPTSAADDDHLRDLGRGADPRRRAGHSEAAIDIQRRVAALVASGDVLHE